MFEYKIEVNREKCIKCGRCTKECSFNVLTLKDKIISDNDNKWSGDHCIDSRLVPAVLFSNKKILNNRPALWDITADVLTEFGIPIPAEMEGKPL